MIQPLPAHVSAESIASSVGNSPATGPSPLKASEGSFQDSLAKAGEGGSSRTERRKETKDAHPQEKQNDEVAASTITPLIVMPVPPETTLVVPVSTAHTAENAPTVDGVSARGADVPGEAQTSVALPFPDDAGDASTAVKSEADGPNDTALAQPATTTEATAQDVASQTTGVKTDHGKPAVEAVVSHTSEQANAIAQSVPDGSSPGDTGQQITEANAVAGQSSNVDTNLRDVLPAAKTRAAVSSALKIQRPLNVDALKDKDSGIRTRPSTTRDTDEALNDEKVREPKTSDGETNAATNFAAPNVVQPAGSGGHAALEVNAAAMSSHPVSNATTHTDTFGALAPPTNTESRVNAASYAAAQVDAAAGALQSARLLQAVGQSEMRVAFRSPDLGAISIHTSATSDAIAARIAVDHAELATMLTGQLPEMHARLGANHTVEVALTNTSGSTTSGGQTQGNGDDSAGALRRW